MTLRILIASNDAKQRAGLVRLCEDLGARVFEASTVREALTGAQASAPQIVMLVLQNGTAEALAGLQEIQPSAALWLVPAPGDKRPARDWLAAGVTDLFGGVPSRFDLELALAREVQRRGLAQEREQFKNELDRHRGGTLMGRSRAILRLHDQIQRIASTPRTTVLVTGERGSGKEMVGRSIHASSARARKPFVVVACGVKNPEQVETLLYGSPGDSSPAAPSVEDACALVNAEGGTLYLDQIDALTPRLQLKVLSLLHDRSWSPGSGGEDRHADVRVIASTSQDLARLVEEGRFREDLLYRLNVLSVDVPPLRERQEDISELAGHLLARIGEDMGRSSCTFAPEALEALNAFEWPGNVRELRNSVERGLLTASGEVITRRDLGLGTDPGPSSTQREADHDLGNFRIRHMEEALIRRALVSAQGNRSKTARLLGVNRTTLYNKLRAYRIDG